MSMVSRRQFLYSMGVAGAGIGAGLGLAGVGRSDNPTELTETRLMMGTFVAITARNKNRALLEKGMEQAFVATARAEKVFTRYDAASPLGVLNAQGVLHDAPRPIVSLLADSLRLAKQTGGGFNPTTAPVLDALVAYDAPSVAKLPVSVQSDLKKLTAPSSVMIKGNTLRLAHSGMGLTLDGIAKGHIVDRAAASLERSGVTDYLINAGGDIRVGPSVSNDKGWAIGLQDGRNPAENTTRVPLYSGALATSGNYESQATNGYDHLVGDHPGGALPPVSVTVTAPTCVEADSLATALFAMGIEQGTSFINLHPAYACLWHTQNGLVTSAHWTQTV